MNKKHFIRLMRPKQWIKNFFVFAPLFFSFEFLHLLSWVPALIAVFSFMLISSSIYIINDLVDIEDDRKHPVKQKRPLASGDVTIRQAILLSLVLAVSSFIVSMVFLPSACINVLMAYYLLQLAYSFRLKHQAILDVLIIASGFVLRILMGAYAISVPVSPWIILTTYLLALFLGFGKRYHELAFHANSRKSLEGYTKPLLDRFISISCGTTLLCYALYSVETARELHKTEFVFTVAFVIFGLFRYLSAIYVDNRSGEPEEICYRDRVFVGSLIAWFITTLWILMG